MIDYFTQHILGFVNAFLVLVAAVGGYFILKQNQRIMTIKIQDETITALQQQIDSLKDSIDTLKTQNAQQKQLMETILEAVKQRGIIITIDGDLVTLQDMDGSHSIRHPRLHPVSQSAPGQPGPLKGLSKGLRKRGGIDK